MTSWRNRSTASPESPLIAASPSYDAGDRVHAMAGETTMDDNTAVGCEDDPAIRHVLGAAAAAAAGGHDDDSANENVVAAAVGLEGEADDDATAVHVLTADGHTTQCSLSKELLDDLEKAIDKLDLEADNSLSKLHEKSNEAPPVLTNCDTDILKGAISFRVPRVVKGAKNKRSVISLEKKKGKKNKSAKKKGEDQNNPAGNRNHGDDPMQLIGRDAGSFAANRTVPNIANDVYGQSSAMPAFSIQGGYAPTMGAPYIQGGYTSLLLGVGQHATSQSVVRKIPFDGVPNHENI
ncbi:hypothetical protein ACP70R_014294 [Stipagrostis hirtigluma subsp. patula]